MADRAPSHIYRFLLRLLFLCAVLVWSFFGNLPVLVLSLIFLVYSVIVLLFEHRHGRDSRELVGAIFADILFVAVLVALSGGWASEFHLLFYFVVVLKAPYRSWYQAIAIPALCTAAYLVAGGMPDPATHGFEIVVRIGLLWFLPILLRVIGIRSIREKERAERLSSELSRTHEEIRRYTAELEKANSEKERQLADITLIHQFVMEMRQMGEFDVAYATLLNYAAQISEAPWIALLHSREGQQVFRVKGDPPKEIREAILSTEPEGLQDEEGGRANHVFEETGPTVIRTFACQRGQSSSLALFLVFPPGHADLMEAQVEVLSALMDAMEMEAELLRLQENLREANLELSESNRHLMRLHELQAELSQAFLSGGGVDQVIGEIQNIMAKELFELDRLNLFLPDRTGDMLQCRTSVGIGETLPGDITVPTDRRGGAISKSFREGRTIFFDGEGPVPDELRLAEPYSLIPAIRSRIFVIVPLVDHTGHVLGVIGADRKHTHQPIPASTITMLEFFARHVALVLGLQAMVGGSEPGNREATESG